MSVNNLTNINFNINKHSNNFLLNDIKDIKYN